MRIVSGTGWWESSRLCITAWVVTTYVCTYAKMQNGTRMITVPSCHLLLCNELPQNVITDNNYCCDTSQCGGQEFIWGTHGRDDCLSQFSNVWSPGWDESMVGSCLCSLSVSTWLSGASLQHVGLNMVRFLTLEQFLSLRASGF